MRTGKGILAGLLLLALLLAASPASADCATDPCEAGCDFCATGFTELCYFNTDDQDPTKGVPLHFATMPIKYKINADNITAGLDKAAVIAEVQKAIAYYENIPCSTLEFKYEGESTSTSSENGMLLIYWGNSPSTWTHADLLYFPEIYWSMNVTGEANWSAIGLNATPNHPKYKFDWSINPEPDKWHIYSFVLWLLPMALGWEVSMPPAGQGQIPICPNKAYPECPDLKAGAAISYFDTADTTCTKPTIPNCQPTAPPGDGPPAGDGQPPTGDGQPPTGDSGPSGDGSVATGDAGGLPPGEDDGCCRVGHARSTSLPFVALLGLALLALLGLTRRRR